MQNSHQILNNLTLNDLEKLIESIVKKTLTQEKKEQRLLPNDEQILLNTFNQWEDEQTDEKIIAEIYNSRNSNLS